jgi:hypothetical protein
MVITIFGGNFLDLSALAGAGRTNHDYYFFHTTLNSFKVSLVVIPAKAGIHNCSTNCLNDWIPALAGMTDKIQTKKGLSALLYYH